LKALGGFLLILNENGDIIYATENIKTLLGFHQVYQFIIPAKIFLIKINDLRRHFKIFFALRLDVHGYL
jgi:hypothetical protein